MELCRSCGVRPCAPSYLRLRGNYRCSRCYQREATERRAQKWDDGYRPKCRKHTAIDVSRSIYVHHGRLICSNCIYKEDKGNRSRYRIITGKKRDFIRQYKSIHPCVDCGESDVRCLDFDHNGDKHFALSDYAGKSLHRIKKEIEKCTVRCANCHRKKHIPLE